MKLEHIIAGLIGGSIFAFVVHKMEAPTWAVVMTFLMVADSTANYRSLKENN